MLSNEALLRLLAFAGVLTVLALWELASPRRSRPLARAGRWPGNLGVVAIDALLERLLLPVTAIGLAFICETRGWGLLQNLALPGWAIFLVSFLVLDLAIYAQHVLFHALPSLWRLHRMHHADQDIDVTTGLRFHPIEILLSAFIKLGVVAALGASASAVLTFQIALNATSMFNHSNVGIPLWLDRILRWLVVTPDMHRVHHSIIVRETNSNFGFNLPWWDRLFGTYRDQPAAGHDAMVIGIDQFREPREQRLDRMLTQPFRGEAGAYPRGSRHPK